MSVDYHTTTVEAAAAVAREDPYDDRPTLAELAGDVCPSCGLRPTWVDELVCEACRRAPCADCWIDPEAGW